MIINWFSPIPPTRSSIALDTAAVLPVLARKAKIVVWTHEAIQPSGLEQYAQLRHYDPRAMPWEEINAADATVYHLGNHPAYHGPIWQVNRRHPGIVILHDLNMQHFFAGLVTQSVISRREYLETMESYHPEGGRERAEAFLSGAASVDEIYEACPLTGAAIENAEGVVVHTQEGRAQLAALTDLPVVYVPLLALPASTSSTIERKRTEETRRTDRPYRIIMFGFLGLNRRLGSFLKALHQFPQRNRFHLDVYGTMEKEESLLEMVDALQMRDSVTFHGFVSNAELDEVLGRSHLAINLRDPTMGEASACQLRIWQHALPSLVTNIGWYATLPENTVAFVRREAELEDILAHLRDFLAAPEHYCELGRSGRLYVQEHHTVEAYVNDLMQLVDATIESRSRQATRWMADRAGKAMSPWFNEKAASVLLPRLTRVLGDLFDEKASGH